MKLVFYILMLFSSLFAFIYGAIRFIGKKGALFKALVTYAMGTLMLGRLYETVTLLISKEIHSVFNIGMLAIIGGFMFFFSASFGQMDGLVDDHDKNLLKYRIAALAAPTTIMSFAVPVWISSNIIMSKITTTIILVFIAITSFIGLKHFIIPDVSYGIISSIRGYSLLLLVLAFLYATQITSDRLGNNVIWVISSVLLIIVCPIIIPVMEKGSKKWTA